MVNVILFFMHMAARHRVSLSRGWSCFDECPERAMVLEVIMDLSLFLLYGIVS